MSDDATHHHGQADQLDFESTIPLRVVTAIVHVLEQLGESSRISVIHRLLRDFLSQVNRCIARKKDVRGKRQCKLQTNVLTPFVLSLAVTRHTAPPHNGGKIDRIFKIINSILPLEFRNRGTVRKSIPEGPLRTSSGVT